MDNLLPLKDGSGLIDAEFHKSVGPEHAASAVEQVVSPEELRFERVVLAERAERTKSTHESGVSFDPELEKLMPDIQPANDLIYTWTSDKSSAGIPGVVAEPLDWYQTQISSLQNDVDKLQEFNRKLLFALKQHGFDTNKLFR